MANKKTHSKDSDSRKCDVILKTNDGYHKEMKGLSYAAGLAVAVIVNRASAGLPVSVVYEDEDGQKVVEVPTQ